MQPQAIIDYIDQEPLYGTSERCFYYVLHSLAEKGIQISKYEPMHQALQQKFGQVERIEATTKIILNILNQNWSLGIVTV